MNKLEADIPRQYRQKLARIALDGSQQFIAVLDADGLVLEANRALLDAAGVKLADVEGQPFWQGPWWAASTPSQDALKQAILRAARGDYVRYDTEVSAGKATLPLDFSVTPAKDESGKLAFIVCEGRDITARKAQERELAQKNAELQSEAGERVKEAVSELEATLRENERLLGEAKSHADVLKEANQSKDEFLAKLAHDLRNTLAPLSSGVQVLQMKPDGEQAKKVRNIMDVQLKQLARLVDELAGVSSANEDKVELQLEQLSLQSIVNAAIEASSLYIEAGGHVLVLDMPEADIWVIADFTRLTQVVSNLLSNAAIYTAKGGRIKISMWQEGLTAHLLVADNGVGIAAAMLDKIFEQKDGRAAGQKGSGPGIGLTLTRNLIQMHGGGIKAESPGLGMGSTFTVTFPAALPMATPSQAVSGQSYRVLVVDDNIDSAQTIGWMMEKMGHTIQLAHDGVAALEQALSWHPEIILLDIGLPGRNGYEVCRELRKLQAFRDTLIIAQTGWGQKRDKDMAQLAGFDHHLTKPLTLDSIAKVISQGLPYK